MSAIDTIKTIARVNFGCASSDFADNPSAENWKELKRAMYALQSANQLTLDKLPVDAATPLKWLNSFYSSLPDDALIG